MGFSHIIVIVIVIILLCTGGCLTTPARDTGKGTAPDTPVTADTMLPAGNHAIQSSDPVTPGGDGASRQPLPSTVRDLTRFVEDAVIYSQRAGKENATLEFADKNGSFTRGEQYIRAYGYDGINLADPYYPGYQGQNQLGLTDSNGVRMIEAMRDIARNGSGFVSYHDTNPVTGRTEPVLAYIKRVDDTWWLASGMYGPNITVPADTPEMIRDLLKTKVSRAALYARNAGKEEALRTFNNISGTFSSGGTYIFAFDMNGTTLAMPFARDHIGINERNLTDINGVSIGEEKLRIAGKGGGYFYYVYNNPADGGKPQFKVSYVEPADSGWVLGAGMYLPEVPIRFPDEEKTRLVSLVKEAVAMVKDKGKNESISVFNTPGGKFSGRDMYIFVFDQNGTQLANPYMPGLIGQARLSDRDRYGSYPMQALISQANRGGGFTYYFFADPNANYTTRLKLGYTEPAGENLVVGSGIFPDE